MAKPRELYSGAAPQAMSLMGMGIADAYANAGRIQGQGYMAMGQGIAQGISTIGSVAGDYMKQSKEIEKQNKSYEKLLSNEMGQKFLGLSPETADQYLAMLKDEKPSVKNKLLSSFFEDAMKAKGINRQQAGEKDLKQEQGRIDMRKAALDALLGRTSYGKEAGLAGGLDMNDMGFSSQDAQGAPAQPSLFDGMFNPSKFRSGQTSWDR